MFILAFKMVLGLISYVQACCIYGVKHVDLCIIFVYDINVESVCVR